MQLHVVLGARSLAQSLTCFFLAFRDGSASVLLDLNWNISKSIEVQQRVKYGDEKLNYYNEDLMTQNDDISWLYLLEYP